MRKKKVEVTGEDKAQPDASAAGEAVVAAPSAEQQEYQQLKAEVESLKVELQSAQSKSEEYLDGWQRSRAEFANYKKRMEREQALAGQITAGNIIKHFLDVVDDLDRALKNRPQDGEGATWASGIDLIYHKFITALEAEGVKRIEAEGQFFDPNLHEAISQEDHPELESGMVIGVAQQGFSFGDRVLRPARVRVAR